MPPVTTQPVQPEAQLSDTIAHKDTTKIITPDVSKVATTTQPVAKKEEAIPVKAEPQTVTQQPATSACAIQHIIRLREPRQNIQSKKEKL